MLAKQIGCLSERMGGHINLNCLVNQIPKRLVVLDCKFFQPPMFVDQLPAYAAHNQQGKKTRVNEIPSWRHGLSGSSQNTIFDRDHISVFAYTDNFVATSHIWRFKCSN